MSRDTDIVASVIDAMVRAYPSYPAEIALRVEVQIRADWGGVKVGTVAKSVAVAGQPRKAGRPPIAPDVRRGAFADGLTDLPTEVICNRRGISRASMYRLMKTEGGNG